jgi:hypothetical protein
LIITSVFEKNAIFFAENCKKLQKVVIVTSNPGHPDPGFGPHFRDSCDRNFRHRNFGRVQQIADNCSEVIIIDGGDVGSDVVICSKAVGNCS